MGLDMYLTKRTYVGAEFSFREVVADIKITIKGKPCKIDPKRISEITEVVGYWRKANQIHNWFVTNCQDGVDECQETIVSLDDLKELYNLCKETLKTRNSDELPPTDGFFFGSTEIDDGYWDDLELTVEILDPIVKEEENHEVHYIYRSSW